MRRQTTTQVSALCNQEKYSNKEKTDWRKKMTSKPRSYGKNDDSGGGRTQENYEKNACFIAQSLKNRRRREADKLNTSKRTIKKAPPYCAIYGKSNSKRKSGQASRCLSKSPISSNSSIIRSILRFLLSAAGAAAASRPASEICGATVFIVPSFSSF